MDFRLLEAIPQLASHTLDDGKLFKETDNMAMMIRTQPCTKDKGLGLVQFRNGSAADISLYPDEAVLREALAFLYLPLDGNCPSGRAKRDTTTIDTVKTSFVVYKTQKLFRAAPPTPGSDESDDSEEECCKVKDWPQTNFVVEADILTKQLEKMDITSHNLTNPVSIGFYVKNSSRVSAWGLSEKVKMGRGCASFSLCCTPSRYVRSGIAIAGRLEDVDWWSRNGTCTYANVII